MMTPPDTTSSQNWKRTIYMFGAALGTLFGLLSAYLYARVGAPDHRNWERPEEKIERMR